MPATLHPHELRREAATPDADDTARRSPGGPAAPASCLYAGWVRHRRHEPVVHAFRYRLFQAYLDLDELPGALDGAWGWSARGPALAWFRRADYGARGGDPRVPLAAEIRALVARETGAAPTGPIRILTHPRTFGYVCNPVSFYYCFDARGERVETIVAEITNTPWGQRRQYVLPAATSQRPGPALRFIFPKDFHVSPFMPMELLYDWHFGPPGERLHVHMNLLRQGRRVFDATLCLHRQPLTPANLTRALVHYPLMTARVVAGIYWQALRLRWRGAPYHPHPHPDRPRLEPEPR